ncbi:MAG: GerW family sporulation protein [Bacillota bacterium]
MSFNFSENVSVMFEKLESFIKSKTIVGEAIQVGDTTLIPIIDVFFGLGCGGGDGTDPKGSGGSGGGGGMGAKATPTAMLVIKGDRIEVLPIRKQGGLEKLVEMVPEIMSKIDLHKGEGCCKGDE